MEFYTQIDGIGKKVSRIFLGTGNVPAGVEPNEWLSSMYDAGITAIDTARVYPDSENTIGKWLDKTGLRENIVILSKCGHPAGPIKRVNRKSMLSDLDKSLENLRTDYIDIYILHRDNPKVNVSEIVETFNEMQSKGKIKLFGGSNWTHQRIEEANEYAYKKGLNPFSVSSPSFSLANQLGVVWDNTCVTICGDQGKEARKWYIDNRMPVVAYSALGRGLLSGKMKSGDAENAGKFLDSFAMKGYGYVENYERLKRCEELALDKNATVSQIALSWMFRQKMNMFAVISTSNQSRMKENIKAFDIELTEKECDYLNLLLQNL